MARHRMCSSLYMQLKCITLMTSRRQRHAYVYQTWKYGRNMKFKDLVSERALVTCMKVGP